MREVTVIGPPEVITSGRGIVKLLRLDRLVPRQAGVSAETYDGVCDVDLQLHAQYGRMVS